MSGMRLKELLDTEGGGEGGEVGGAGGGGCGGGGGHHPAADVTSRTSVISVRQFKNGLRKLGAKASAALSLDDVTDDAIF